MLLHFFLRHVTAATTAVLVSVPGAHVGAQAQGKLEARYTASIAGLPIGRGAWVIEISDDQFTAAASGATSGVLRMFAAGEGTGASRGSVNGGQPIPSSYAASITYDRKLDEVRTRTGAAP